MTAHEIAMEKFAADKTLSTHAKRSREVARALDAEAPTLPYANAQLSASVEFEEFVAELTPKRFQLLRLAIRRSRSVAELAKASHRDQNAVSRDVTKLARLGLVKIEVIAHPGREKMKMVTPVATRIAIEASLDAT